MVLYWREVRDKLIQMPEDHPHLDEPVLLYNTSGPRWEVLEQVTEMSDEDVEDYNRTEGPPDGQVGMLYLVTAD